MEKNIGDVLSLIESQSLKCKINSNNKYPIVFKDIGVTKYSFINGLPNMTIKCELRFIKTKYNSNVPLLNNITFPSIFRDIYDTICKKYFNDDIDYLNFNDDSRRKMGIPGQVALNDPAQNPHLGNALNDPTPRKRVHSMTPPSEQLKEKSPLVIKKIENQFKEIEPK